MSQRHWLFAVPAVLFLGVGGRMALQPVLTRAADPRIADGDLHAMEGRLGYHLYAPTWLPEGGHVGVIGTLQGKYRILQDFADCKGQNLVFLAQERRTDERDAYHRRRFMKPAEARAEIDGKPGYFITGSNGERRLFWNEPEMALILSSSCLSDGDLLKIARKVK
jgi:hypothetical protein